MRSPDSSANPYLAIAVCLMAGLGGIEDKIKPPAALLTGWKGSNSLPVSLHDAVMQLKKDKLMKEALGEAMLKRYADIKLREWNEYQAQVTSWEIEQYLDRY